MPRFLNISGLIVNTSFSRSIDIFSGYALGHVDASVMGCPFSLLDSEIAPQRRRETTSVLQSGKRAISIFVLSTMPNCLAWAWFVTGDKKAWRFDRNDPNNNVGPPEITNCSVLWSQAVPQVDDAFQNAACAVAISLDRAPAIKIGPQENPDTVEIAIKAIIEVSGQSTGATDQLLFRLLVTAVLQFAPTVSDDGTLISAALEDAEIIPELLNSTFATPIDMARVKLVFNAALGQNSDALENFVRSKSFRIPPVDHIKLIAPTVDIRADEIVISFDPAYVD
jgi:hypothetical protein